MKIEVGKTYEVIKRTDWFEAFDRFLVTEINGNQVTIISDGEEKYHLMDMLNNTYLKQVQDKPAHYDTAIDTIAFAKANFSREQVEGFMRINAIKYLQRAGKKDDKLSDLRKSAHYLQMLIEMEEEK